MKQKAAIRYAQAFFGQVKEDGKVADIYQDLRSIRQLIDQSQELKSFLQDPLTPPEKQREAVRALFSDRVHPATYAFLLFLIGKSRLNDLALICEFFERFYFEKAGILKIIVVSARPLRTDQLQAISAKLKNYFRKDIDPHVEIAPELLGGFQVRVGDLVYDWSVQTQLERFREGVMAV